MASIVVKMRKQTAVWWPATGADAYGNPTFGAGVQVKCRWEDRHGEFFDAKGNSQNSKATVYVDREMKVGDILWKGALTDSDLPGDPEAEETAYRIIGFDIIPSLKNKLIKTLYIAHL